MELMDVDQQRLAPELHSGRSLGGAVFNRNCMGTTNEITNELADTHLEQHPADEKMNETKEDMYCRQYGYVECIIEECNPLLWKKLAAEALKYYSKENHGAELKLVGEVALPPLIFERDICGFHLSFQAQDTKDSSVDIFAEVFRFEDTGDTIVAFCDIMDPTSPNVMKSCDQCRRSRLHPKNVELYNFPPSKSFRRSTR